MKLSKDICTVLYYTSNTELEPFASNIRKRLVSSIGDLPLISVSQKPLPDFGTNICVGEVGVNEYNEWRQVLLGCEKATTPFIIVAEADALYPPEYFDFIPPFLDKIYRYDNIWIMRIGRPFYLKKDWTEGAQILGREFFIKSIERALAGWPMWNPVYGAQISKRHPAFPMRSWDYFGGINPVVSVKTGHGLRLHTGTQVNTPGETSLPYWGDCAKLQKELLSD
jgi:hypothetical protein